MRTANMAYFIALTGAYGLFGVNAGNFVHEQPVEVGTRMYNDQMETVLDFAQDRSPRGRDGFVSGFDALIIRII